MNEAVFKSELEKLNPEQRRAVEAIEGPVMVIAGPGTGKTQILTLRIANILLQTDMRPENILALTFTESGAKAMRERLKRYVGVVAYRVPIYTFHGFAQHLIHAYPEAFSRIIGGRPATDIEKVDLMETILDNSEIKILRPMGDATYYVPALIRIISSLKQEYLKPDDLVKIIDKQEKELDGIEKIHQKGAHKGKVRGEYVKQEKVIAKNRELLFVYRQYEQLLKDKQIYDFDDMIIETVKAMEQNHDLLLDLQETYQYVLADEHQDVNGSQNKILEYLCNFHDSPNIFVVGDEKQAIFRFQGASLENFLYFMDLFPTTTKIVLTDNYRSGQNILDAAHSLVRVEDEMLSSMRIPLKASLVKESEVYRRDFSHEAVEDDWLVEEVVKKVASGVSPKEIAVILRTNREVEIMAERLAQKNLPVFASADGDILDHPITESIQALIDFVLSDVSEAAIFKVLHGAYFGLPTSDLIKIASARSYQQSLATILTDKKILTDIGVQKIDKALAIMEVQKVAREMEVYAAPHRVLEYLLEASGFLEHVMKNAPLSGGRVVRRLYDEVEAQVIRDNVSTLKAVSQALALRRHYGFALQAPYIDTKVQAIQVITAHKSKGLEFSVVFIPHLKDGNWGGKKNRNTFTIPIARHEFDAEVADDDEKRLFYVAMTRAKHELLLSSSASNIEGKDATPSRLFDSIEEQTITTVETTVEENSFEPLSAIFSSDKKSLVDSELILKIVSERGFSATSLNNYLNNPWHFVYRNVLRIPEVQPLHMQFGTVVHNVLQKITTYHTAQKDWPKDSVIKDWLEVELRRLPISQVEYTQLHEKGMAIIFAYLSHLMKNLPEQTKEEMSIRVMLQTGIPEIPEVPLTGKLDRIDFSEVGEAVRVVDYKTGKPKTRNYIEGKTATADGGYKRQLVFYALLLSLYDDDRYRCREGVLSFVEPATNGTIKEESFVITDEEIEDLKKEIIEAILSIKSGEFLNNKDLAESSDYASLAKELIGPAV